jgi:hypothetical protein
VSCARFRRLPAARCSCSTIGIPPFPPPVTRNQYIGSSFLRRPIGRCERERLMLPNLIARW